MWAFAAAVVSALGSKASINQSMAQAQAEGGYGEFTPENRGGINSALIQFDNPVHVVVASAVVIGTVYLVKKWGK